MPRVDWPPYRTVRDLVGISHGVASVVMGGGSSRLAAMPQCPPHAIYISANDHGCRHFLQHPDPARRISYVVACDKIEQRVKHYGLPIISRHMFADYRLLFMPAPSSGMSGAWLARLMGCAPIILTGMDLYVGPTYADDAAAQSTGHILSERQHLERWHRMMVAYPAQYRTIGCSKLLENHCGCYDPSERPEPVLDANRLSFELQGEWIKLTADSIISMRPFRSGEVLELTRGEAQKLVRERRAVRVKPGR